MQIEIMDFKIIPQRKKLFTTKIEVLTENFNSKNQSVV